MRYLFNLYYWIITVIVFVLLLFYVPTFALTLLWIILVIGIIGGVIVWMYRNNKL